MNCLAQVSEEHT